MREQEILLATSDGLGLFAQEWAPQHAVLGVVCVLHGLGEHGGQYVDVAKALTQRNLALIAIDLRGHGRSGGPRGHTPSYRALLDDVDVLLHGAADRHPNLPRFLYGHSLGGNIVVNYLLRRHPDIAGAVVTSPWLWLTDDLVWWKRILGTIIEPFWPTLSFSTRNDRTEILEELGMRRNAELFHNLITVRLLMQTRRAGFWAARNGERLTVPTLLIHGDADPVTDPGGSMKLSSEAGALCELHVLHNVGHNPHEEDPAVIATIAEWVAARASKQ